MLAVQSRYPALPPTALELEITERIGGIGTAAFGEVVKQFRSCGLRVSLDDFGSQYANLPLFTNVKFDTVKLDRSLITGLVSNPINRMLVQDIVHICQTYDMTCVAEGGGDPGTGRRPAGDGMHLCPGLLLRQTPAGGDLPAALSGP